MAITTDNFGQPAALYESLTYSSGTGISVSIKTGPGRLVGIMVSAASGTILSLSVYDSLTASGSAIMPTFTPVAGTIYRFGMPVLFKNGLYIYSGGSVVGTVTYY